MDTKKISALLTAVDKGSLTAAAAELGYTQSGLTHMMNTLESDMGLNLLVRSKNGVHLSPAGKALLPYMRALLSAADELDTAAETLRQKGLSSLRLGAYSSVARKWIPAILSEFRRVCPETELHMDVGGIDDIYAGIKNDVLDCAIVSYREELFQGLEWVPLRDDALVAVLPGDEEARDAFPLTEFDGREFLMPSAGFDVDIMTVLNAQSSRINPRIIYTRLDDESIISMVEHGLGVSILAELIVNGMQNNVRVMPLDPPAWRSLGIIYSERRQGDKNIRRFVKCAQSVIAKLHNE